MPLIILGLAALGGGIAAWALFRNTVQVEGQSSGAPGEDEKVQADTVVDADGNTTALGASSMSTASGADSVPELADEDDDRPARSAAAATVTVSERYTADAFLDMETYSPDSEWCTRTVDNAEPDIMKAWVADDIVIPRDVAGGPISSDMNFLEQELK